MGADVVIESTGFFTTAEKGGLPHLQGGTKKVIVSAPASGDVPPSFWASMATRWMSVQRTFSNGSCTTNSVGPLAKVLNDAFGIESGLDHDPRLHW